MRSSRKIRLAIGYFVLSAFMLVWPVYPALGNHIEPRVLGMPWSLIYVLMIVGANFVVLCWLYLARVVDAEEPDEPEGGRGHG